MTVATVDNYVSAYWGTLEASLNAIDEAIYTDLVANAAVTIELFDHDFLTLSQINQAQALLVCIDASEFLSIGGNNNDKYYSSWKVYDRSLKKDIGMDPFTGAFCRLLKITFKEYTSKTSATRSVIYSKTRSDSIYLSGDLDQRGKVYKDYDLSKVRDDRKAYPLDNRYL